MRKFIACGFLSMLLLGFSSTAFAEGHPAILTADRLRNEKSYQLAIPEYEKVLANQDLAADLKKEAKVKLLDCVLKSQIESRVESAHKELTDIIAGKDHDRWWAEANESLAQYFILRDRWSHQTEIIQYYDNARDYWAGSSDMKLAKAQFVRVSFDYGDYLSQNMGWYYQGLRPIEGRGVISGSNGLASLYHEILKVTDNELEKARATYALGMCYLNNYSLPQDAKLAEKYFTQIIDKYKESEWVDDAYFQLGQYYERQTEFEKALTTYRDYVARFRPGMSQWLDNAKERIKDITAGALQVSVGYHFLPGSEIQFNLGWKNIDEVQVALYKVDLVENLQLNLLKAETDSERGMDSYQAILKSMVEGGRLLTSAQVLSFSKKLKQDKPYQWMNEHKGLAEWLQADVKEPLDNKKGILPSGAYLLLVSGGGQKVYELVLVSDLGLVSKTAGQKNLFYVFDGQTGAPVPGAKIKFHSRYYNDNGNWVVEEGQGVANDQGLLDVPLKSGNKNYGQQHSVFAVASSGDRQTFIQNGYYNYYGQRSPWWIYATSDRPAYRPQEEISYKAILRQNNGSAFVTPSGVRVKARLFDPKGSQIKEQMYVLNNYGSFHDQLTLDQNAALGEYRLEVYTEDLNTHLGSQVLFRLEEYKLPEFLVNIKAKPLEESVGSSTFKLGDTVTVELDAQYYFGGPVASADVEYLVYQNYYYHYYYPSRPYDWYYESFRSQNNYYDKGQLITQGKIKTTADGKAIFTFETPKGYGSDLRYVVEARVVDQSRREISATTEVKVMRFSYLAFLTPKQSLYRPGDKAEIEVKTLNANDEPLAVEGKVSIKRNWWIYPIAVDAKGQRRDVASELELAQGERIFEPGRYDQSELFTKFVKTNERGDAIVDFQPERDGYYIVEFTGFDKDGTEIKTSTAVYVCAKESKDIGYRYGGLQIIPEKDTFKMGEVARVMLVADRPDTWVLLSSEAEGLHDYRLVHLEGNVKLVEIPVTESFIPNVFLVAISANDYQLKSASTQLIVPPEDKFLNILVSSNKELYQPREDATYDILVTDIAGKPVQAEIGLGITDAAVYYIQQEYLPDIRKYFYGQMKQLTIATQTSFYQRPYRRLVRGLQNELLTDEEFDRDGNRRNAELSDAKGDSFPISASSNMAVDALTAGGRMEEHSSLRKDKNNSRSFEAGEKQLAAKKVGYLAEGKEQMKYPAASAPLESLANNGEAGLTTAQVRTDFRSTVLWLPVVQTDVNGKAQVKIKFPDSLTSWRTTARAITTGTAVGNMTHETKTQQDIIVRLQAPRFFTERDSAVISANVHNYTDSEQKIKVTLQALGMKVVEPLETWVTLKANSEQRVDWTASAQQAGVAELKVMAQTTTVSDAMQRSYPIMAHGLEKFVAQSVALKGEAATEQVKSFTLNLPKERIPQSTSLRLTLSPSLAASMLDALPYLADYPYGCVEQTMSRFIPAVIVRKTMRDLGFTEQQVQEYIQKVLVPREDPKGHPQRREDVTISKLDEMVTTGLARIYDFQHADGGWGWWKEGDSDRFMSAYVVWGLSLANLSGVNVRQDVLANGANFVRNQLVEEENNPDMLAWMLHALSHMKGSEERDERELAQSERLWAMRDKLNPYARALFALYEHHRSHPAHRDRAQVLARNLVNGVQEDKDNGTVHWGESGINYRWSEGGVEATAFNVKALASIEATSAYLEPAVRWMILNRRGASWKNTRDTAIAILGLADYLRTTKELTPDYDYAITVNEKVVAQGKVTRDNMFSFDRYIDLTNADLVDGDNQIKVSLKGPGALYVAGHLKYFTLEENIPPAGNEVFVTREYYREEKKPTLLKGYLTEWKPLKDGDKIRSGERIRVEVTLEAKNNYEYLIVEDYKPAGCEAVELKSGSGVAQMLDSNGDPKESTWLYQEFRDQKAAFFFSKVKQGKHRIQYELRAEVPGEFHAMPNQAHAMYVPEIRANSQEARFTILDAPADE